MAACLGLGCGTRTELELPAVPTQLPGVSGSGTGGQSSKPDPKPNPKPDPKPDPKPKPEPEPEPEPEPQPERCRPDAPFSTPQPVPITTLGSVDGAWVSVDGLDVVYASANVSIGQRYDLFYAHRAAVGAGFDLTLALSELNSTADERLPVLSRDGKTIYFTSNRLGDTLDVYVAERPRLDMPFGTPRVIEELKGRRGYAPASLTRAADKLYFSANRLGGPNNENMYFLLREGPDPKEMFLLSGADSDGSNVAPVISSDELTLYFASTRQDPELARHQVYFSHRDTLEDGFLRGEAVQSLASDQDLRPTWISDNECWLLLTRELEPASGHYELVWATRQPD